MRPDGDVLLSVLALWLGQVKLVPLGLGLAAAKRDGLERETLAWADVPFHAGFAGRVT